MDSGCSDLFRASLLFAIFVLISTAVLAFVTVFFIAGFTPILLRAIVVRLPVLVLASVVVVGFVSFVRVLVTGFNAQTVAIAVRV